MKVAAVVKEAQAALEAGYAGAFRWASVAGWRGRGDERKRAGCAANLPCEVASTTSLRCFLLHPSQHTSSAGPAAVVIGLQSTGEAAADSLGLQPGDRCSCLLHAVRLQENMLALLHRITGRAFSILVASAVASQQRLLHIHSMST